MPFHDNAQKKLIVVKSRKRLYLYILMIPTNTFRNYIVSCVERLSQRKKNIGIKHAEEEFIIHLHFSFFFLVLRSV